MSDEEILILGAVEYWIDLVSNETNTDVRIYSSRDLDPWLYKLELRY